MFNVSFEKPPRGIIRFKNLNVGDTFVLPSNVTGKEAEPYLYFKLNLGERNLDSINAIELISNQPNLVEIKPNEPVIRVDAEIKILNTH